MTATNDDVRSESAVLVGFDASDEARDALSLGRVLARGLGARLVVATAFAAVPPDDFPRAYPEAAQAHFAMVRELVRDEIKDDFEWREVRDTPVYGLAELASELSAEVVVVGSTHRSAVGRVLLGSVAEALLNHVAIPVAVAPRGYAAAAPQELRRIGVGYVERTESRLAMSEAIRLSRRTDARLEVITAFPGERDRLLAALPEEIGASDAAEGLLSRAAELDLLVLGSRGRHGVRRLFLGSTSVQMIREAVCPVMVVPIGAADEVRRRAAQVTETAT